MTPSELLRCAARNQMAICELLGSLLPLDSEGWNKGGEAVNILLRALSVLAAVELANANLPVTLARAEDDLDRGANMMRNWINSCAAEILEAARSPSPTTPTKEST
jgi:hypothetical protein